jgi:hypothetical protein
MIMGKEERKRKANEVETLEERTKTELSGGTEGKEV